MIILLVEPKDIVNSKETKLAPRCQTKLISYIQHLNLYNDIINAFLITYSITCTFCNNYLKLNLIQVRLQRHQNHNCVTARLKISCHQYYQPAESPNFHQIQASR